MSCLSSDFVMFHYHNVFVCGGRAGLFGCCGE